MNRAVSVLLALLITIGSAAIASTATAPPKPVVIDAEVDVANLDPAHAAGIPGLSVLWHIFEPLVARNPDERIGPALATSWRQVDPLTWQFRLRRGVVFHNGQPFTAAAVKYSLERLYDPKTKTSSPFPKNVPINTIAIVDDYTINIVTKTPVPILPDLLTEYAWIVEPQYYATHTPEYVAAHPVGTGPYRFVEWVKDSHATLARFDRYWGPKPVIQQLTWRVVPETATKIADLKTGAADLITNVPPDFTKDVSSAAGLRTIGVQTGRRIYIGMATDTKPFTDVRVRQALNYGVDVDTIIKTLLGGYGRRMAGFANTPYENPKLKPYPYDPAKAKALLAEAGYPNGFATTLEHPVGRYVKDQDIAQAIAADLSKIGVTVNVQPLEFSVWINKIVNRGYKGLYMLGESGYFECQQDMNDLQKDYAYNASKWNDADFERTYTQLGQEANAKQRLALCYRLQEIAYNQAPYIFLYKQYLIYGLDARLRWKPRPDEVVHFSNAALAP